MSSKEAPGGVGTQVVGGGQADVGEFPYFAAVQNINNGSVWIYYLHVDGYHNERGNVQLNWMRS